MREPGWGAEAALPVKMWAFPLLSFAVIAALVAVLIEMAMTPMTRHSLLLTLRDGRSTISDTTTSTVERLDQTLSALSLQGSGGLKWARWCGPFPHRHHPRRPTRATAVLPNPKTTTEDLPGLLDEIRAAATEFTSS